MKTTAPGMMQGLRCRASWLVDVADDDEPSGHGERARGRCWMRLRRAAGTVTSRATSGRVREGTRERESECVWELGGRERVRPRATGRRGERLGGGKLCGKHAVLTVEKLLACLAKPSSSLERWLGWAGRWVTRWAGRPGKWPR